MANDTTSVDTFSPLNATGMGEQLAALPAESRRAVLKRGFIIGVIAFLTLIDLFGSQALLPTLVEVYGVSPATIGFAVNASTLGMAAASLAVESVRTVPAELTRERLLQRALGEARGGLAGD